VGRRRSRRRPGRVPQHLHGFREPDWQGLCAIAETAPDARTFFELFFRPVLIGGDQRALFTGYFEPELDGSRTRTGRFRYPVYRVPPEVGDGRWLSRAEIETSGVLEGVASKSLGR
jgi:membrane-bound lytic murein transglycosylase A